MYYHASPLSGLKKLVPHVSNHNKPLVYLSKKRENTLVYLSNAVEKFCEENGLPVTDKIHKWASYGFNENGILVLEEYYPNATEETYSGISGYIYSVESNNNIYPQKDIPFAAVTEKPIKIKSCEYISDAYREILRASEQNLIILKKYEDNSKEKLNWIKRIITKEYNNHSQEKEYYMFLKSKFKFL